MATLPRKLTFNEAWNSTTIFFVDESLEAEIDAEVETLLLVAEDNRISEHAQINVAPITNFLQQNDRSLEVILKDIELSEEKFLRIVTLLRKLGRIPGGIGSDDAEWSFAKIRRFIAQDTSFAKLVAELLVDGKRDVELSKFIPRYYLDTLNYREIMGSSSAARRVRYKRSLIGTYGGRKGYKVESRIKERLEAVRQSMGIDFDQGRSSLIETNIDFAIPNLENPWVIIMSSFQETTSSGQTIKARDMLTAYENINRRNSRYGETRAFVNFVDGGGWLARKRDFARLVDQCHYFVNLQNLEMIDEILLNHVPQKYYRKGIK